MPIRLLHVVPNIRCIRRLTSVTRATIVVTVLTLSVFGEERTQRRFDRISGFTTASIFSVAQDKEGFLWVGIEGGGLARFDGREFRRWATNKITTHLYFARGAGEDLVLIVEPESGSSTGNSLYHISGDSVEPISGPGGQIWSGVRDAAWDDGYRLWVAAQDQLYCRSAGAWITVPIGLPTGARIRRLAPNRSGGIFVVTSLGIQSIDRALSVLHVVDSVFAADAIDRGDGSIFYAEMRPTGGGLIELRDGHRTEVLFLSSRFNHFVLRGKSVWAVFDSGVVAMKNGEPPEVLGPVEGIPGGSALVDREGSLWMGTAEGLVQIPEPETVVWNQRDGLPLPATRYLAKTDEGLWLSTWGGLSRLGMVGGHWKVIADEERLDHKWPLSVDASGALWGKHRDSFLRREGGRFKRYPLPESGTMSSIARASDGTLWIGTDRGLFKTTLDDAPPSLIGKPAGISDVDQVFEDSRGEIWIASANKICHAPALTVASAGPVSWACAEIEGVQQFSKLIETPGGRIWAGRWVGGGVWEYSSDNWRLIRGSQRLPASSVINLINSQAGGVWVLGIGFVVRVIERPDLADGWEVAEELNVWQGLPATGVSDLIEEQDGTLWIASSVGVVRIKSDARNARPEPPRIRQTAFVVNGRPAESNGMQRLAYDSNQIELHFAALSYRSPGLLRYQYRLRSDDPWIESKSLEPVFRFFDLRPGRYSAEVRASLDGINWSATPARSEFEVLSPWYLQWWAISALLLLVGFALFAAHRARVAVLLRLEHQRASIAMDLHDEIGSGLGSIGILSGVAASGSVGDDQRRELVRNIVDTTAELGNSLTDIVWSLRPDLPTLEGLAYRLTQRGSRLFPDGGPVFKTEFPKEWPAAKLSLSTRHSLLLIASEALFNAARHSSANRVVLGMSQSGRDWRLWIADDGRGISESNGGDANGSGLGLISMRRRAEQIGAELHLASVPSGGTTVTVKFSPEAKDRRPG